jgi:putative ABC transport system ATP-binding protein
LDGQSPTQAQSRAVALLVQVGLGHRLLSYPAQLSGGEMQRAAVARAVVAEPQLIVADEPTGSLDSANGQRVMQLLADLNRERGLTILLATHSNEAAAFARRLIRMRDGRFEEIAGHERIPSAV